MNNQSLYDYYNSNGFKIIFSTGYSSRNTVPADQPEERYKAAKKPLSKGWTSLPQPDFKMFDEWLQQGGWVSVVIPAGVIAIDVDQNQMVNGQIMKVMQQYELKTRLMNLTAKGAAIHLSNNGKHYLFRVREELKASQKVMTKLGINVTYRTEGKSNIIVAPSNDRSWERPLPIQEMDYLPDLLMPINTRDRGQMSKAMQCQLAHAYSMNIIQGNTDIDLSFMGLLVKDMKFSWEEIEEFFKGVYGSGYEEEKTKYNYKRANGAEKITKTGSFFQKLYDSHLYDLAELTQSYIASESRERLNVVIEDKIEPEKMHRYAEEYALHRRIIYHNSQLFSRENEVYLPLEADVVRADFTRWLTARHFSDYKVSSMLKYIQGMFHRSVNPSRDEVLLADNTVLSITNHSIRGVSENDLFFNKLPVLYNSRAKCERFTKFLEEIFPLDTESTVNFLQEYMGYSLTRDTQFEVALVLRGEGANGKSVLMNIWQHILGEENVSHLRLSQFKNEYMLVGLQNKLLNIASETGSKDRACDDLLKMLISGEKITANIKFQAPIEFHSCAKFVFSSNNPIISSDRSAGYERRLVTIPFIVNFDSAELKKKKDYKLIDKLKAEADGIFLWCLEGLKRLYARGRFEVPGAIEDATSEEHKGNNPVWEFAHEFVYYSVNDVFTPLAELYDQYAKFCQLRGYQRQAYKTFLTNLKRVARGGLDPLYSIRRGARGYRSIRCKIVPYDPIKREYHMTDEIAGYNAFDEKKCQPITDISLMDLKGDLF